MRVMSLWFAIGFVSAFCPHAMPQPLRTSNLVLQSTRESWSGLEGKLMVDGKEFTLTEKGLTEPGKDKDLSTKPLVEGGLKVLVLNNSVIRSDAMVQVVFESAGNVPEMMYLSYADAFGNGSQKGSQRGSQKGDQ